MTSIEPAGRERSWGRTPADFARARQDGEFRLHYQVQVDRAGRPCAAEALLRVIVAEGIETADQFAYLLREGCDIFPGYYFGRPTSPEQLGSTIAPHPAVPRTASSRRA